MADDHDAFLLLFGSGARRDEEFADAVRRVEEAIAEAIEPLIDADIDAAHRRTLAYALVGLAEGASRQLVALGETFDPDRCWPARWPTWRGPASAASAGCPTLPPRHRTDVRRVLRTAPGLGGRRRRSPRTRGRRAIEGLAERHGEVAAGPLGMASLLGHDGIESGQAVAIVRDLAGGERLDPAPVAELGAEQLQLGLAPDLDSGSVGIAEPRVELRSTERGQVVGLPPPPALVRRHAEQALLGQAGGLAVDLRVGHRPELRGQPPERPLEVVRRGWPSERDEQQHGVGAGTADRAGHGSRGPLAMCGVPDVGLPCRTMCTTP